MQSCRVAHDTPLKRLKLASAGLGLGSIDQVEPFQRSAKVRLGENWPPLVEYPTAVQSCGITHETLFKAL